jgi:predicted DNA-binding protein (UPF0278 family)
LADVGLERGEEKLGFAFVVKNKLHTFIAEITMTIEEDELFH